jgi:hypothetical protein
VIPSDWVSGAPLTEVGVANKSEPGAGSCSLKEKSARRARTFPAGSLARLVGDAAAAKEPRRRGRRICGASLQ